MNTISDLNLSPLSVFRNTTRKTCSCTWHTVMRVFTVLETEDARIGERERKMMHYFTTIIPHSIHCTYRGHCSWWGRKGAVCIYQYLGETTVCFFKQILGNKVLGLENCETLKRKRSEVKNRSISNTVSNYRFRLSLPGAHHLYVMQIGFCSCFSFFVKYYQ